MDAAGSGWLGGAGLLDELLEPDDAGTLGQGRVYFVRKIGHLVEHAHWSARHSSCGALRPSPPRGPRFATAKHIAPGIQELQSADRLADMPLELSPTGSRHDTSTKATSAGPSGFSSTS